VIKGLNLRLMHNMPAAAIQSRLEEIKVLGADTIALVTHHYCYLEPGTPNLAFPPVEWGQPWLIYPDVGQDPQHVYLNTPSQDTVYLAARMAKQMGFDVFLKPHIDSNYGAWRGWISVPSKLRADLEWAYRWRFLARYLAIAGELGCGLVIGTELLQFGRDMGVSFWINIAHWCRTQRFRGPLTYAANWGEEVDNLGALWADPAIDYIGVDAYYPIIEDSDWSPICEHLGHISKAAGDKKVLFTEVGYQNAIGSNVQPWGVDCATAVLADITQVHYSKLMRQSLEQQPWFAGYLVWEAERLRTDASLDACETLGISHVPTPKTAEILFGELP
jgi:hypothetical protein